jgi:His-Xaa-Ser system protein HxsD
VTTRFLHEDGDGLLFEVDLDVYGLTPLQRVAHKFTDRCFVHLKHRDERTVEVRLKPKTSREPLDLIAGEFCNEILDQRLREVIALESESVRNLVIAHALSRVGLADSAFEESERNDPRSE